MDLFLVVSIHNYKIVLNAALSLRVKYGILPHEKEHWTV